MSHRESHDRLIEEVDFLLAEQRHLQTRGVHLIVEHFDHVPGTICAPGEMIGNIALGGLHEPVPLGFSHMSLLLMDCLCRYRLPLSAQRIEQIMNTDPFYIHYATNQIGHDQTIAKPDGRTVRVYVGRIRKRMDVVFKQYGLRLDPLQILTSELTDSNVMVYRLKASAEFVHKKDIGRPLRTSVPAGSAVH